MTGSLGGWLGSSPREETHRDRDDRDDRDDRYRDMPRGYRGERRSPRVSGGGDDSDDFVSRGYSTARDITDTIARSARDYRGSDRDRDRDYR